MSPRSLILAAIAAAGICRGSADAAVSFDAVAAGDMTDSDVILWTRATDDGGPANVTAQLATDATFRKVVWSAGGSTIPDNDFTLKLNPAGLKSGTRYFYRFIADGRSMAGQFKTAPAPGQNPSVIFAFTGDADGRFRPYPSIANISRHNLDFFIFLGDVIYETASGRAPTISAPVPALTPASDANEAAAVLPVYNRKYLENISGVTDTGEMSASGQRSLVPLFAATGAYTLLDNHELGNASLQSGGAPPVLLAGRNPATTPDYDVNTTGKFDNQTLAFLTLEKAFFNYHPTRVDVVGRPATGLSVTGPRVDARNDPRLHGTARNYFSQRWGKHAIYIQVDDRSYRDARLGDATGGELATIDPRGDNAKRTMIGATQLDWLKRTLIEAKNNGVTWKFVAISSPIDMTGNAAKGPRQDQKSWFGGYRAERKTLLKFIADNAIDHVVFLATDDHMTRINRLQYDPVDGPARLVPGAFQIVTGPIGAGGPDQNTHHDFDAVREIVALRTESLTALGQPIDGLAGLPGLRNVRREFDPEADVKRQPADFASLDTFGYAVLSVDPSGTLTVSILGIPSYLPNSNFLKQPEPEHYILSFQIRPR